MDANGSVVNHSAARVTLPRIPTTKPQAPSTREATSRKPRARFVKLGARSFPEAWCLKLGVYFHAANKARALYLRCESGFLGTIHARTVVGISCRAVRSSAAGSGSSGFSCRCKSTNQRAKEENPKPQAPSIKPQARPLSLAAWSFPEAWSLEFEALSFIRLHE